MNWNVVPNSARRFRNRLPKKPSHFQQVSVSRAKRESTVQRAGTLFGDCNIQANLIQSKHVLSYTISNDKGLWVNSRQPPTLIQPAGTVTLGQQPPPARNVIVSKVEDMVAACLRSSEGVRAFKSADVIARESTLRQLLHGSGEFYVSYLDGKLYLEVTKLNQFPRPSERFRLGCVQPQTLSPWNRLMLHSLGGMNILLAGPVAARLPIPPAGSSEQLADIRIAAQDKPLSRKYKDWLLRLHLLDMSHLLLGYQADQSSLITHSELISREEVQRRIGDEWKLSETWSFGFQLLSLIRDYCQAANDQMEINLRGTMPWAMDRVWHVTLRGKRDLENPVVIRELKRREKCEVRAARKLKAGLLDEHKPNLTPWFSDPTFAKITHNPAGC